MKNQFNKDKTTLFAMLSFSALFRKSTKNLNKQNYTTYDTSYHTAKNMTKKGKEIFYGKAGHPNIADNLESGQATIDYYKKNDLPMSEDVKNFCQKNPSHYVTDTCRSHHTYTENQHISCEIANGTKIVTKLYLNFHKTVICFQKNRSQTLKF